VLKLRGEGRLFVVEKMHKKEGEMRLGRRVDRQVIN